jgi:Retrotransposon gag protein
VILRRLPLRYPTFGMLLRNGLNPVFPDLPMSLRNGLKPFDNWKAFLDELCTNFGPYDETGDAEHELTNLRMRDNQRVSDYLVRFSGLALRCSWGEPALRYRFYKGLPPQIKDELSKSKKPRTLQVLKQKVQNIDARYWERAQECSREQQFRQNPPKSSTSAASAVLSTTPKPTSRSKFRLEQKPKLKD